MDIIIESQGRFHQRSKWIVASAILAFLILVWYGIALLSANNEIQLKQTDVRIHRAELEIYQEKLVTRAVVTPVESTIISTESGGKVINRGVEPGDRVTRGQRIARLSNHDFVLEVSSRLAAVTEQVNTLRSVKLQIESQNLQTQIDLENATYNVTRITKELARQSHLNKSGLAGDSTIEQLQDELEHWRETKTILASYDSLLTSSRPAQLADIEASIERLTQLAELIKVGLDQLDVISPIDGVVSSFNLELGQQLESGNEVAVVDDTREYIFEVALNEFYLGKIRIGMRAQANVADTIIDLKISSISPEVKDGKFLIKLLELPQENLSDTKHRASYLRGQSINVQILLAQTDNALLIPTETIYRENGQTFVYRYQPDSQLATKTLVEVAGSSDSHSHIVNGIDQGDQLIHFDNVQISNVKLIRLK